MKLEEAMRNLTFGDLQIWLVVIWLELRVKPRKLVIKYPVHVSAELVSGGGGSIEISHTFCGTIVVGGEEGFKCGKMR